MLSLALFAVMSAVKYAGAPREAHWRLACGSKLESLLNSAIVLTMSKMSCYDELCLPRVSPHSSYCPVSNCQYGYLYVCSQICQIMGWSELRGRNASQDYRKAYGYSAGSTSCRNLPGLQHFLQNFQELSGHAAIFHGFLSTNLVSVKLCACSRGCKVWAACIQDHLHRLVWCPGFFCWCPTQCHCSFRCLFYNWLFSFSRWRLNSRCLLLLCGKWSITL